MFLFNNTGFFDAWKEKMTVEQKNHLFVMQKVFFPSKKWKNEIIRGTVKIC